ncbi:hypothetical protein PC9H_010227 [Pleurotus ostreatus]|uniref:Uncharacterized protein n=1 Tax=Pleurotus ostreatus TaxID=5322 RepID=A0A8H7DSU6_PLEOS|nr:uncharacterized protein PC9H_010227 [Pleurotus ostreatus]KAF7424916.1 hypothetical protein PC9H_010227 [Pleurotus ostreatus]
MQTSLLAIIACVAAAAYALPLDAAAVQAKRDGATVSGSDDINISWCFHPNVCAREAKQVRVDPARAFWYLIDLRRITRVGSRLVPFERVGQALGAWCVVHGADDEGAPMAEVEVLAKPGVGLGARSSALLDARVAARRAPGSVVGDEGADLVDELGGEVLLGERRMPYSARGDGESGL